MCYFGFNVMWWISKFFLNSCSESDSVSIGNEAKQANEFLGFCQLNYDGIISADMSSIKDSACANTCRQTRSAQLSGQDNVTIYVNTQNANLNTTDFENQLAAVKCAKDLITLSASTGAEFSTNDSTNSQYTIQMSEKKAKLSLKTLVDKSKEYLYAKGFSDSEITTMLDENGADETELVRLVLALSSVESTAGESGLAYQHSNEYSIFNLFALPAHAKSSIDWDKVGHCGLEALGVDFMFGSATSTLKTWCKTAIKKAFKTIAKRMLGPLGVIIAVGEFSYCMWG